MAAPAAVTAAAAEGFGVEMEMLEGGTLLEECGVEIPTAAEFGRFGVHCKREPFLPAHGIGVRNIRRLREGRKRKARRRSRSNH